MREWIVAQVDGQQVGQQKPLTGHLDDHAAQRRLRDSRPAVTDCGADHAVPGPLLAQS